MSFLAQFLAQYRYILNTVRVVIWLVIDVIYLIRKIACVTFEKKRNRKFMEIWIIFPLSILYGAFIFSRRVRRMTLLKHFNALFFKKKSYRKSRNKDSIWGRVLKISNLNYNLLEMCGCWKYISLFLDNCTFLFWIKNLSLITCIL